VTVECRGVFSAGARTCRLTPKTIITDHYRPYIKAVDAVIPLTHHVRTGLHRRLGYTTQPIERGHVPTHNRLRGARGLRTVYAGQKFLESFEALHALRRGMVKLRVLVPRYRPTHATEHEKVRAVMAAMEVLGNQLRKAA
jgi:transposase-like protein